MLTQTLQGALQAQIRSATGKTNQDFNGDLHDLCDIYALPAAPISGRIIGLANKFDTSINSSSAAMNYLLANSSLVVGPAGLFATGAQGAWYDPSDSTTLFEDTAGTIPSPTPGAGALSVVGKMLDKSGNGNHAISYNTTTARPELSARVNLLTYSEQFDNAVWTKDSSTLSANVTTAPDGTNTADKVISTAVTAQIGVSQGFTGVATTYTASFSVKQAEVRYVQMLWSGGVSANYANFDLQTGTVTVASGGTATITAQANGFYRITLTSTLIAGATSAFLWMIPSGASGRAATYAGNGTDGFFVWGADLRPANIGTSVPAYQRIADQYTYDSNGFPRYLVFNGTASGMYTPANLNLSATDKVTVFAGVRKLSDAATGMLTELSPNINTNNGAFYVCAPSGAASNFEFSSKGTTPVVVTRSPFAASISAVLTMQSNIGAPTVDTRVNTIASATSTSTQGTGNFTSNPLNIGVRSAAAAPSLFFNGYIYSLIVVGAASTAAQISSTESWINVKEGGVY